MTKTAFATAHRTWVGIDASGLLQGVQCAQPWGVKMLSNDTCALIADDGRAVSVTNDGSLQLVDVLTPDETETFTLVPAGPNRYALKNAWTERFVSCRPNGKIACDRESASLHEQFTTTGLSA
jgi:hypothetical protein